MNIEPIRTVNQPTRAQKAATALATGAALTGGVVYMAKKGKLDPKEGGFILKEGAKAGLKNYADFVVKTAEKVSEKASAFVAKHPKIENALNFVSEKATVAKDFTTDKVNKARNFAGDKIEKVANKVSVKPDTTVKADDAALFI